MNLISRVRVNFRGENARARNPARNLLPRVSSSVADAYKDRAIEGRRVTHHTL